jgi:hypothetical protein
MEEDETNLELYLLKEWSIGHLNMESNVQVTSPLKARRARHSLVGNHFNITYKNDMIWLMRNWRGGVG